MARATCFLVLANHCKREKGREGRDESELDELDAYNCRDVLRGPAGGDIWKET